MRFKAKVNGKVIYEEPVGVTAYTMLLETGDYITFRVNDSRGDKVDFGIEDKTVVDITKEE